MNGKRLFPALVLALALGTAPAAILVVAPSAAHAAAKTVSAKVGKPLGEAQKLMEAKKWKEALAQLQVADQIDGKSAYEQFIINSWKGSCYNALGDNGNAAKAYEATLTSGELTPQQVASTQKALASMYAQAKNYSKASSLINQYLKSNPNDAEAQTFAAQVAYTGGDYATASKYAAESIRAADATGKRPPESALQMLMSSQYKAGDTVGYGKTLERLVANYPKAEYWSDLLNNVVRRPGLTEARTLDVYRLQVAANAVKTADDYTAIAETALLQGYPGEAKSVLERGFAAGILGKGSQAERQKRLLAQANQKAADDQRTLAMLDKQAAGAANGEAYVKLGEAYASYGQFDKAIAAIQAGIAKGVKDPNVAKLNLARAYFGANQKEKAKQTLSGINGKDAVSDVARLWLMHLRQNA